MASIEVEQSSIEVGGSRQSTLIPAPPASAFGDDDEDYRRVTKQQHDAEVAREKPGKRESGTKFGTATLSKASKGFEEMQAVLEMERKSSILNPDDEQNGGDGSSENSADQSTGDSDESAYSSNGSWKTFAQTKFHGKTSHSYCCAPLQHPLLPKRDRADHLAALASWVTLLRIMGDLPETEYGESFTIAGQTINVVQRVRDNFLRKYTKKDIDDAYKKYSDLFRDPVASEVTSAPFLQDNRESMLEKVQYITSMGIYKADLRDEIYCQVCKQLTNNPSRNSSIRGWVMLYIFAGSFLPSERFAPVLLAMLRDGPTEQAQRVERHLRRAFRTGTRGQPPSWLEFQAAKNAKPVLLPVILMNSARLLVEADSATTVGELCAQISHVIGLEDRSGFSIYITLGSRIACLGHGMHRIMDAISECETHTREQGLRESSSAWRLYFRREFFTPWYEPGNDVTASELTYRQIMRGVSVGEYKCDKEEVLVLMAAQKYFIDNDGDVDSTKIEEFVKSWLPKEHLSAHEPSYWVEKVKKEIENDFLKEKPNLVSLKSDIVTFAMNKWYNLFSRFYDVDKVVGPSGSWTNVIIGINCKGYNIMDEQENVKVHLSFIEITRISKGRHTVSVTTVQGDEYTVTSIHTEDLFDLLSTCQTGLRRRSKYGIVVHDASHFESAIGFGLVKGDLVRFDLPFEEFGEADVYRGIVMRNGKHGNIPRDVIYVLPTTEEPPANVMGMLTLQLKKEWSNVSSAPSKTPGMEGHTLQAYAKLHFRQASETAVGKLLSKASLKRKDKEHAWKFTKDAMKKPLLRRTGLREDLRRAAVRSFNAIQMYMGDMAKKEPVTDSILLNENIIDVAMRNRYLRDEIFCQVMKQLTENPNKLSEERGWHVMWMLLTCTFPQSELLDELEMFLRTNPNVFAKRCLEKLHMTKRDGCRYTPPHQMEYDALANRHPAVEYQVLFPDQSKQKIEVDSSTRMCDVHSKIVKKLQLKNSEEYGLFFGLKDKDSVGKLLNVAYWDYFFDYLSHIQRYYMKSTGSHEQTEANMIPPVLIFMKKLWMNAIPGRDKLADSKFHFPQEVPNFLRGYHACSDAECVSLGALLFKAKYGDEKQPLDHIEDVIPTLLPRTIIEGKPPSEWKKLLQANIAQLKFPTKEDAKVAFLKMLSKWQTYGSVFFEVRQRSTKTYPKDLIVAVNHNGVGLVDTASKEVLVMHSFDKIPNWAFDEHSFTLVIGEGSSTSKIYMETTVGHNMDDLIMSYVGYIMNTQIKKKPSYAGIVVGESVC
ncbi:myosin-VIIa-like isoform X3 [Dreissena polymorpha]|uniref:myosin-VIIa-like isoform X3 n=1 Tax=Dreissena polymorpha TaxID=45954 RepID=UPI002263F639|nr:myosin-VIIa-like isoform X3 [Dreissena polymorpha]